MRPIVRQRLTLTSSLAALCLVAGCANSLTSYRTERFGRDGPAVITQDAKTRNLVMVPERTRPGGPVGQQAEDNQWRVCAEAAPDVFSAMSASAAARLGLNLQNSNAQTNLEGAMALAEVAGTIERTAYLNMLREAMYRTCERYLSGAISRAAFVVQAGRDWRMMLYGLTIQQLTQTARPPSTILTPPTTQARLASADREKLQAAQERLRTATDAYRRAEDLHDGKCPAANAGSSASGNGQNDDPPPDGETPTDPPVTPPAADGEGQPPTTPTAEQCAARQRAMDRAKQDQDMAKAEIESFGVQADGTAASTGSGTNNAGNGGGELSAETLTAITPVIEQIVKAVAETDETQLLCLQVLAEGDDLPGAAEPVVVEGSRVESVRTMCLRYLAARVGTDTQRLAGYQVSTETLDALSIQMRIVEAYLGQGPGTPADRWNALVQPLVRRFEFNPITVPANATMEQIRAQMRRLPGELETLVALINQGGS